MKKCVSFLAFLLVITSTLSFSQTKKELEKKRAKLQKEIDETNRLLQTTSKNKNRSIAELNALDKKIKTRKELILTINSEIDVLGSQINYTNNEIGNLENKMEELKDNYAKMVVYAYKNKNEYQRLMFVFASSSFNQAYKRLKYLQQYSEQRKNQAMLISETNQKLTGKKTELEFQKKDKTKLKSTQEIQKKTLDKEKGEQEIVVSKLQQNEKKLLKQLADKQAAKEKLDRALDNLIRKEIEAAKKKATAAGNKNVTNTNVFTLTPEAQKLSSGFASNRGALPWPVEQGTITGIFGDHPHNELKGIVVKSNGIDISTNKGSSARVIFQGEVTHVTSISGNKVVIVRHGEFLSVYSNLDEVFVKQGDKLSTKERIGSIHTNKEDGKTELHLEIWKGFTKMDPKSWLAKK